MPGDLLLIVCCKKRIRNKSFGTSAHWAMFESNFDSCNERLDETNVLAGNCYVLSLAGHVAASERSYIVNETEHCIFDFKRRPDTMTEFWLRLGQMTEFSSSQIFSRLAPQKY